MLTLKTIPKHDDVYFSVRSKHLYVFYISNLFTCPVSKLFTDAHAPPLDHWSVLSVSTSKWLNYLCKEVCILSSGKAVFLKDTCHPFIWMLFYLPEYQGPFKHWSFLI